MDNKLEAIEILEVLKPILKDIINIGFHINRDESFTYYLYYGKEQREIDYDTYKVFKEFLADKN